MVRHPIPPVYDNDSQILILGSFPSVKSRETGFFYGHPRNRFWRVVSSVFCEEMPGSTEDKKNFLLRNRIALWDVIESCEIAGSSDAAIKNVTVNDLSLILRSADIKAIYANGKTAQTFYKRYTEPVIQRPAVCLPSTSPANAAWGTDRLIEAWKKVRIL